MRPVFVSRIVVIATAVIAAAGFGAPAVAQSAVTGQIVLIAGDPQDFVVQLDKNGRCGSAFFHMQRSSVNFKEMVSVELTAFATNRPLTVFITGCAGDRNIISHGFATK